MAKLTDTQIALITEDFKGEFRSATTGSPNSSIHNSVQRYIAAHRERYKEHSHERIKEDLAELEKRLLQNELQNYERGGDVTAIGASNQNPDAGREQVTNALNAGAGNMITNFLGPIASSIWQFISALPGMAAKLFSGPADMIMNWWDPKANAEKKANEAAAGGALGVSQRVNVANVDFTLDGTEARSLFEHLKANGDKFKSESPGAISKAPEWKDVQLSGGSSVTDATVPIEAAASSLEGTLVSSLAPAALDEINKDISKIPSELVDRAREMVQSLKVKAGDLSELPQFKDAKKIDGESGRLTDDEAAAWLIAKSLDSNGKFDNHLSQTEIMSNPNNTLPVAQKIFQAFQSSSR